MIKRFHDYPYFELVERILKDGVQKGDRTGTGTLSVFGHQMRFDLTGGSIPMLTSKKMHIRSIIHELLWYLAGDTNVKYLQDNGVRIWNEWADANGDLGPVYGAQWRSWKRYSEMGNKEGQPVVTCREESIDQIGQVIETLRTNPNDRRMIVSAWNVADIPDMRLPPCHLLFQFWSNNGKLSCQLYQRSCDVGLGVPFNIVQYSILTHMIANVVGMEAAEFIWTGGDVHIYNDHVDALSEQIFREPYPSPFLRLPKRDNINDYVYDDFVIEGYESHPAIKMEVSV